MVEKVALLVVPTAAKDEVFYALGDASAYFSDNGGEPDGFGPYLARADWFTAQELAGALEAGAQVRIGYQFYYEPAMEPVADIPFCGYDTCYMGENIGFSLEFPAFAIRYLEEKGSRCESEYEEEYDD
jgi:hypothetical protein